MKNCYSHILSPIRVAGHLLRNRIISGPSTIHTASSGQPYPTEEAIRFFEDRAKAGVGMVTCAGVSVGGAYDDGVHASWDVNVPNHRNRLVDLVERIHLYGAKCTMELIGILPDKYTVCDGCTIMGWDVGHEIPVEKMMEYKQNYIETAVQLKNCGFDGILFHFGHSIPLAQFLSPYTNKRTDQYGGSTENRCRFLVEILDGVRKAVGPDMIFDVRISGSEYQEGGIDLEEGIRIGEHLQPYADILQISAGMHNPVGMTITHPCAFLPPMPNVWLAEGFKQSGKINTLISTVGGITSLADADRIIAEGKADLVVMTRAFIADLDVLKKDREGRHQDVTPCIKCMRCHDSDNYAQHMQCAVNPMVGLEGPLQKAMAIPAQPRKVAVIGGGPAGMQAALTAAERGHAVTLFEKTGALGGALKFSDFVPFKYALKEYKDFLVRQVEKSSVALKLNTEAAPADLEGFDAVIAAVGAEPLIPPIPGAEHAMAATDTYGHEDQLGQTIVVVGGGQVGCETGLHFAKLGKKVTILEMQNLLAPDASRTHRDELILEMEREKNLTSITGCRCASINRDGVTYRKDDADITLPADAVILAVGMKPRRAEVDSLIGTAEQLIEIGDCVKARTVEWAAKEGFYAALTL